MKRIRILLFTTFITTCQNINVKKQIQERYKQSIQFFESDLVDHFPSELPDSCGYTTTISKTDTLKMLGFGVDYMYLWKTYNQSKYSELSSYYQNLSKAKYTSDNTNLLLVFSYTDVIKIEGKTFRDQESPELQAIAKHNITMANSLPIPLFEIDQYKSSTMSSLPKDFKLYILDAKPGKYIDDKYLQECDCLPKNWKHGYSKGVAMSDERNVVIYWINVW